MTPMSGEDPDTSPKQKPREECIIPENLKGKTTKVTCVQFYDLK